MLVRLINEAGKRKVDNGLKMLIETHLVLASGKAVLKKYCKKTLDVIRAKMK